MTVWHETPSSTSYSYTGCMHHVYSSIIMGRSACPAQAPVSLHESSVYLFFSPVLSNETGV